MNTELKEILDVFGNDIEFIRARLDYRRNLTQISKWLANFDTEDYAYALELLKKLTVVSEEDLYVYCEKFFKETIRGHDHKVYICPIGKYGKSSTLLSYYLKKTEAFQNLEKLEKVFFIETPNELRQVVLNKNDMVVFFDDFFGTGNSLVESINKVYREGHPSIKKVKTKKALCLFYMHKAEENLSRTYSSIQIVGEIHHKLFDDYPTSFKPTSFANLYREKTRKIIDTKKIMIKANATKYYHLGYYDSEAFITFPYLTPNNTIPYIWTNKKKWYPLFPRQYIGLEQAFIEKKLEIMTLSMENHFNLNLEESEMFKLQRDSFFLNMILLMKKNRVSEVEIIQLLGIDESVYHRMIELLKKRAYVNETNKITAIGEGVIEKIKRELKKINNEKLNKYVKFEEVLYVPKSLS